MMILIGASGGYILRNGWLLQFAHGDAHMGTAFMVLGALVLGGAAVAMKGGAA